MFDAKSFLKDINPESFDYRSVRLLALALCRLATNGFITKTQSEIFKCVEMYCDGQLSMMQLEDVYRANCYIVDNIWCANPFLSIETLCTHLEALDNHKALSYMKCILRSEAFEVNENKNVIELTKTIYHDNEYQLMPILADALEESECKNEQVLNHCRGRWFLPAGIVYHKETSIKLFTLKVDEPIAWVGPCWMDYPPQLHSRGCWVIENILFSFKLFDILKKLTK